MSSAVCTLFEGDYHYGVGALVNSLYQNGFRGVAWVGYRGDLPPWIHDLKEERGYKEFKVAEGCVIRFVTLDIPWHLTNYKPSFMMDLWTKYCPDADALFYFDPDIVVKCRWSFFEEWVCRGVALCGDGLYDNIPCDHPIRYAWKEYLEKKGYSCQREVGHYYNGGFIGLHQKYRSALCLWGDLMEGLSSEGVDLSQFAPGDRSQPFHMTDQDVLNIVTMVTSHPLSTINPSGMDFNGTGFTMAHARGVKPWRKHFAQSAVNGIATTSADRMFLAHSMAPIQLYSQRQLLKMMCDLRLGAVLGRFMRRN